MSGQEKLKFGSFAHARLKMLRGYWNGTSPVESTCYALVGATIRLNEDVLRADPASYIQLYETPSGQIAHAALWYQGHRFDDMNHIGGADRIGEYREGERMPVSQFLALAAELAQAPEGPEPEPVARPLPAAL